VGILFYILDVYTFKMELHCAVVLLPVLLDHKGLQVLRELRELREILVMLALRAQQVPRELRAQQVPRVQQE
jgi:hypothetical protein